MNIADCKRCSYQNAVFRNNIAKRLVGSIVCLNCAACFKYHQSTLSVDNLKALRTMMFGPNVTWYLKQVYNNQLS